MASSEHSNRLSSLSDAQACHNNDLENQFQRPHVYPICSQRRYIIEPEKLIYHGKFRDLFCSIFLEKSKFIEINQISKIDHFCNCLHLFKLLVRIFSYVARYGLDSMYSC